MPHPASAVSARGVPPSRPVAATIAVVVRDDRVLLVRRANPPDAGRLGVPGRQDRGGRNHGGLRYLCVVGLLLVPAVWLRPDFPSTARGWCALITVGFLLQAGYFAFTYLSLRFGLTAGTVALITSQQPILMGLLAPAIVGEKVTGTRWLGLIGDEEAVIAGEGRADGIDPSLS